MDENKEVITDITIKINYGEEILISQSQVFHNEREYALIGAMSHIREKPLFLAKAIVLLPDFEYLDGDAIPEVGEFEEALIVAAENLIKAYDKI